MVSIAIIADDLTGAADSAAFLAGSGMATLLPMRADGFRPADVITLSTESRDLPAADAARAAAKAVRRMLAWNGGRPALLYKKLDSGLRGQLAAELTAVMDAAGAGGAVVAPALPSQGRTTVDGRQLVEGIPLEDSAFGGPDRSGNLLEIFAASGHLPVQHVGLAGVRGDATTLSRALRPEEAITVVDAETEDDLDRIARAALAAGARLLAGSAGLARAVVRTGAFTACHETTSWRPAGERPVLAIAGTRHESTARQVCVAAAAGLPVFRPHQEDLDNESGDLGWLIAGVARELKAGQDVVVTTEGLAACPRGAAAVAARVASVATAPGVIGHIGGLILTGGDVAAAVCAATDVDAIWLRGEVQPAIPWGTLAGGELDGVPVITKAGSFGDDQTLLRGIAHLHRASVAS